MDTALVEQIRVNAVLGECILWDHISQSIWWTDIEGKVLSRRGFSNEDIEVFPMPERLCAFAFIQNSDSILCGFETGFALFTPKTNKITWLKTVREKGCGIRLNDGRVDPLGRFWIGEMTENSDTVEVIPTRLFCLETDGTLSVHEQGMSISNGLSWTADGETMFFADSTKHELYVYDKNPDTGFYKNKRIFARTPLGVHPDGSCLDAEGFLWNAQWGSGKIIRYSRDGAVDFILPVPCMQPTCITFGGPNLNHLIVSTARLGDAKLEPDDGDIFIYETPYKGVQEHRYIV